MPPGEKGADGVTGGDSPEQRRDQHDQGDIEREAGAGPVAVHRVGLVAVREHGREHQEGRGEVPRQGGYPAHAASGAVRAVVGDGVCSFVLRGGGQGERQRRRVVEEDGQRRIGDEQSKEAGSRSCHSQAMPGRRWISTANGGGSGYRRGGGGCVMPVDGAAKFEVSCRRGPVAPRGVRSEVVALQVPACSDPSQTNPTNFGWGYLSDAARCCQVLPGAAGCGPWSCPFWAMPQQRLPRLRVVVWSSSPHAEGVDGPVA